VLDEGKHQDDVLGWGFSAQKRERKGDVNQAFNTYMCSRLISKMLEPPFLV